MWSYYGSKSRVVGLYPKPKFGKIKEPFAGSARYSLRYFENDVTLCDKYDVVVKVWKYLQACSPKDILGLPRLTTGLDLRTLSLSEEELLFLGINAGVASVSPRFKVSPFIGEQNGRFHKFRNIANQLYKIKHWKIIHGSYEDLENESATWFIDPPYQFGGNAYVHSKIDFIHLSEWSKGREGQAIVCENSKANWMEFIPISKMRGANQKFTNEAFWTNLNTSYNNNQLELMPC